MGSPPAPTSGIMSVREQARRPAREVVAYESTGAWMDVLVDEAGDLQGETRSRSRQLRQVT
jgi:hypothetical protein